MTKIELVLLFLFAIAIGWALAWYEARKKYAAMAKNIQPISKGYFLGLNYLLNEQPDRAIDAFLEAFDVNHETVEIYLALGSLFRRRGEVDRAIKVHLDLLARPNLERKQQSEVQLALARDYLSAGLLDRAEKLLQELVDQGGEYRPSALDDLLNIYEQEKEWEQAIAVGEMLLKIGHPVGFSLWPKQKESPFVRTRPAYDEKQIQRVLGHYCCELAELAIRENQWQKARQLLKRASEYDRHSVRASLLWGHLEFQEGHPKEAIKVLEKIQQQDPVYFSEALPRLFDCYKALNQEDFFLAELHRLLSQRIEEPVVLFLADCVQQSRGDEAAQKIIADYLPAHVSAPILQRLLAYQTKNVSAFTSTLQLLREWMTRFAEQSARYQCDHCGFKGKVLHWMCPGCKRWGTSKPI